MEAGSARQRRRFTQVPSRVSVRWIMNTLWKIRSELEIRERPVLDEGLLNLLLSEDAQGIITASNSLYVLVHQTLPQRLY